MLNLIQDYSQNKYILPSIHSLFLQLRYPEGEGAHEVVPAGEIPVPNLHWQAAVLVTFFQVAAKWNFRVNRNSAQPFVFN